MASALIGAFRLLSAEALSGQLCWTKHQLQRKFYLRSLRRPRENLQSGDASCQVCNGFNIGRTPCRATSSLQPTFGGAVEFTRFAQVMRENLRRPLDDFRESFLYRCCNTRVQCLTRAA